MTAWGDGSWLPGAAVHFLTDRHLATLTTTLPDGSPHVTPVGFTVDPAAGVARVICDGASRKARNCSDGGPAALCQVDGARWLTLSGQATVSSEPGEVEDAVRRYAARYREPRVNPTRVVIVVRLTSVIGSAALLSAG